MSSEAVKGNPRSRACHTLNITDSTCTPLRPHSCTLTPLPSCHASVADLEAMPVASVKPRWAQALPSWQNTKQTFRTEDQLVLGGGEKGLQAQLRPPEPLTGVRCSTSCSVFSPHV